MYPKHSDYVEGLKTGPQPTKNRPNAELVGVWEKKRAKYMATRDKERQVY